MMDFFNVTSLKNIMNPASFTYEAFLFRVFRRLNVVHDFNMNSLLSVYYALQPPIQPKIEYPFKLENVGNDV